VSCGKSDFTGEARSKYLRAAITYESIRRVENYSYTWAAMREAILNAAALCSLRNFGVRSNGFSVLSTCYPTFRLQLDILCSSFLTLAASAPKWRGGYVYERGRILEKPLAPGKTNGFTLCIRLWADMRRGTRRDFPLGRLPCEMRERL
jgi:hypothetical protein